MKKYFLSIILTIAFINVSSQEAIDNQDIQDLIKEGIELHDSGEYKEAIEIYKEALKTDPYSMFATYELALSYLAIEDYDNAIKFSDEVINSSDEKFHTRAYGVKSEALAMTDKVDEAIKILINALRKIGDDYYLHFNLGLNYYNNGDLDKAIFHAENALNLDKFQSGPYLLSAYAQNDKEMWVQSIISFQFFLIHEPFSLRLKVAFEEMLQTMNVKKTTEKKVERSFIQKQLERHSNTIELTENTKTTPPLDTLQGVDRKIVFDAIENTLDSLKNNINNDSIEVDSTNIVLYNSFKEVTRTIFSVLSKENDSSKKGLFWCYQVPVITKILESPYFETYCRYISVAYFPESLKWWEENRESTEKFARWLEKGDKHE